MLGVYINDYQQGYYKPKGVDPKKCMNEILCVLKLSSDNFLNWFVFEEIQIWNLISE